LTNLFEQAEEEKKQKNWWRTVAQPLFSPSSIFHSSQLQPQFPKKIVQCRSLLTLKTKKRQGVGKKEGDLREKS